MTRALSLLVAVFALLAPGIVQRVGGSEARRDRSPDGGGLARSERPRPGLPPGLLPSASPQGTACEASFGTEIGGPFQGPGTGTWTTVTGDCSATPGCDDFFLLFCPEGELVQASFCHHGGAAAWDTGLSSWGLGQPTPLFCDDDTCGQGADMVWNVPATDVYTVRIGGAGGESGPYTLAVNIPTNCSVEILVPVGLQTFELE